MITSRKELLESFEKSITVNTIKLTEAEISSEEVEKAFFDQNFDKQKSFQIIDYIKTNLGQKRIDAIKSAKDSGDAESLKKEINLTLAQLGPVKVDLPSIEGETGVKTELESGDKATEKPSEGSSKEKPKDAETTPTSADLGISVGTSNEG